MHPLMAFGLIALLILVGLYLTRYQIGSSAVIWWHKKTIREYEQLMSESSTADMWREQILGAFQKDVAKAEQLRAERYYQDALYEAELGRLIFEMRTVVWNEEHPPTDPIAPPQVIGHTVQEDPQLTKLKASLAIMLQLREDGELEEALKEGYQAMEQYEV